MSKPYTIRSFGPDEAMQLTESGWEPSERTKAWCTAAARGFNVPFPSPTYVLRHALTIKEANGTAYEVFPNVTSPDPTVASIPVGTLLSFDGQVNLGAGTLVDAQMIAEATVKTNHKRHGLLRAMITDSLKCAAKKGTPVSLLTVSSGAIYGRFGFTNVVGLVAVDVAPQPKFQFNPVVRERIDKSGRVETVNLEWLEKRVDPVYRAFLTNHRCATTRYPGYFMGAYWDSDGKAPNPQYHGVVHLNTEGHLDGYAIYSVHNETRLEIAEIIYATPEANFALWQHLSSIELIESLHYRHLPNPDALQLALQDTRAVKPTREKDGLWARVLDPQRALSERPYFVGVTGTANFPPITLHVEDPQKIADGTYTLTFDGNGLPRVEARAAGVAAKCDATSVCAEVSVLGLTSLVFGSASASELQATGHLATVSPNQGAALQVLDAVFAPIGPKAFLSEF